MDTWVATIFNWLIQHPEWYLWFVVPITVVVLLIVAYFETRREYTASSSINIANNKQIPTREEAVASCKVAWGLWYTGDRMRGDKLLESKKFTKILLLNPSLYNHGIEKHAKEVNPSKTNLPNELRQEINMTSVNAEINEIPYYYYSDAPSASFTIFDKKPVKNKKGEFEPRSRNAWVCVQYLIPIVSRNERKLDMYKNIGDEKKLFDIYYNQFLSTECKCVLPNDRDKPFENIYVNQNMQESRRDIDTEKSQIKLDIGILIIEGADILRFFKSSKPTGEAWPIDEFKVWREKVYGMLQNYKLNEYHALFFRDTCIDISKAILKDYIEACTDGLDRLEQILSEYK